MTTKALRLKPRHQLEQLFEALNDSRNGRVEINPFRWDSSWLRFSEAEELFCKFTRQFWMAMKPNAFEPLERTPATLEEAM